MQKIERCKRIQRAALNTIHTTKIITTAIEVWQSSTHRKSQTEEVNLHKTEKMPNRRGSKPQRCKISEVSVCSKPKDYEWIQRAAPTTIYKKRLLQEKQKCGNQAHIGSDKQKRFIYTKPTKCPNSRSAKQQRFWYATNQKTTNGFSAQH